MFISFFDTFKNDLKPGKAPIELINELNKQLPEGLKYRMDNSGLLSITSEDGVELTGLALDLSEEQQKELGKSPSTNDIYMYIKNTFKTIQLKPQTPGKILINGKAVDASSIVRSPYYRYKQGVFFLSIPQTERHEINVSLGDAVYQKKCVFEQIPSDVFCISRFQNKNDHLLEITIEFNEREKKLSITCRSKIEKSATVLEVVETLHVYNALLKGSFFIDGKEIRNDSNNNPNANRLYSDRIVSFWDKLLEITRVLKLSIKPKMDPIDYKQAYNVERLYQGIIKGLPVLTNDRVSTITRDIQEVPFPEDIYDKVLFLEYVGEVQFSIMGCDFKLPALIGMFNSKITGIKNYSMFQDIYISDAGPECKQRCVEKLFKNMEELQKYREGNPGQISRDFENAKRVEEYLD